MATRNRPTAEGRILGSLLARWCDAAIAEKGTPVPDRCASCAFRLGTYPNGCPTTQMDALKATLEREPFLCHMVDQDQECAGWKVLTSGDAPAGQVPWGYSTEPNPYSAESLAALTEAMVRMQEEVA